MGKCDCYFQHGFKSVCYGTKEMEECSCGGDERKCNFYPEKRKPKIATEKRLIDANEAIERAKTSDKIVGSSIWETCEVVEFLEDSPIVDAVEVVHGRWRYDSYNMRYYCTECDEEPCKYTKTFLDGSTLTEEFLTDYCPNCGAKMDGEGNDC